MPERFAALVAEIRKTYGFTQEALARHLGVTFSTVNAWEAGRAVPQPRHRYRLEQMAKSGDRDVSHRDVLLVDPKQRTRQATARVLLDAAQALGVHIVIHEEPDDVLALVKIGLLRPSLTVFNLTQQSTAREHLRRLTSLPDGVGNIVIVDAHNDSNGTVQITVPRIQTIVGPFGLAEAGAALRQIDTPNTGSPWGELVSA